MWEGRGEVRMDQGEGETMKGPREEEGRARMAARNAGSSSRRRGTGLTGRRLQFFG